MDSPSRPTVQLNGRAKWRAAACMLIENAKCFTVVYNQIWTSLRLETFQERERERVSSLTRLDSGRWSMDNEFWTKESIFPSISLRISYFLAFLATLDSYSNFSLEALPSPYNLSSLDHLLISRLFWIPDSGMLTSILVHSANDDFSTFLVFFSQTSTFLFFGQTKGMGLNFN